MDDSIGTFRIAHRNFSERTFPILFERRQKGGFVKGWFGACALVPGEHANVPSFLFFVPAGTSECTHVPVLTLFGAIRFWIAILLPPLAPPKPRKIQRHSKVTTK